MGFGNKPKSRTSNRESRKYLRLISGEDWPAAAVIGEAHALAQLAAYQAALLILLTVLGSSGSLQADEGSDQDEKLLRDARVATDGDGLLNFLRSRTLTDADREKLEQLVRRLGSEVFAEREKATADLIARGPLALPFLKKAKRDPDPEIAHRVEQCLREIATGPGSAESAAVVRQLARRAPAGALVVLLDYVPFADDESVEEEILAALVLLARGKADTVLVKALGDGQPRRRGAAAHVLGRSADKEQRAAVAKLLRDPEMRVRLRAVQGLLAGRDKAAVPALIELLTCEVPDVTWQAEELLVRLAGDKAPGRHGRGRQQASPAETTRCLGRLVAPQCRQGRSGTDGAGTANPRSDPDCSGGPGGPSGR